ncbi:hypothetical protein Tco_0870406 [Tanacetum coccineum]
MEPDNMTLKKYLMYEERNRDLARSYTSRKKVAPVRNRILVYLDSDKEDDDNNKVDIDNMTIEEYTRYELAMSTMKSEIQVPTQVFTSLFFNQSQDTPNPPLDKEDSTLDEILDDLFRIGAKNIRKMEHEVLNRCDDITDYKNSDQEDGELPDLPTFSTTNEFASVCEQLVQVATHGVVLGLYLATGKHFKTGLVGYHADGLELWMFLNNISFKSFSMIMIVVSMK